jgi:uncharacterized membrane protein
MSGTNPDALEDRVARLERLLDRVLGLLQELHPDTPIDLDATRRETSEPDSAIGLATGRPEAPAADTAEKAPEPVAERRPAVDRTPAHGHTWGRFRSEGQGALADLWSLIPGGTLLGRLGIGLLLLSVAFFFRYSIDQGWLTEWVRLILGTLAGAVLVGLGYRGAGKGEPLGTVLAGGGIGTFFITGFAGHQWFQLISYPLAFGLLVAVSALGIFLALRSGRQALAVVGLVGALATPLILPSPSPDVAGLALYVCLIVGSVAALFVARGWRGVFLLAAATSWVVLALAVGVSEEDPEASLWTLQGAVVFCALAFWLVPLLRAALRGRDPGRWPRPDRGRFAWSAHMDGLSVSMPVAGVLLSAWLWDLPRLEIGWAFFGTALLAVGVGAWLSRVGNPEGSAETQRHVAILLSTLGLALALRGDLLYLVLVAEAAGLLVIGARRGDRVLVGMGGAVEVVVAAIFWSRLDMASSFWAGDPTAWIDLLALAGAALVGFLVRGWTARRLFLYGAYVGLLAWTARELYPLPQGQALMSMAFGVEGAALLVTGLMNDRIQLQQVGMATLLMVVGKVLLVDLSAVQPIWRVFLLLIFALLFLALSKLVQSRRGRESEGGTGPPESA